jgi:hypothetical protein
MRPQPFLGLTGIEHRDRTETNANLEADTSVCSKCQTHKGRAIPPVTSEKVLSELRWEGGGQVRWSLHSETHREPN